MRTGEARALGRQGHGRIGALTERRRLILLSFLMLFVELALIRWTGSNVIYLSYFSNFVLLGSFLGIGIGFLRARARTDLFPWAPVTLAFFVAFILLFQVSIDRTGSDLIFFGEARVSGLSTWVMLPVIFGAVAGIMAMIAEGVARTFARFESLEAYRLDIVGSIAGIVAFSLLSFTGAPPLVWGAIAAGTFLILLKGQLRVLQGASLLGLVLILLKESLAPGVSWSPYYKVSVFGLNNGSTGVNVNGVPHQVIEPTDQLFARNAAYLVPYQRIRDVPLNDVLVVGAGTGNDVAIALRQGAQRVDAVEIDPRLQEIGKQIHPDRPYDDPRVHVFVDDGRAFLERSSKRYDLILFALPDSITLVSGQSSLRLESYLFTREALEEARDHLKAGGAFAMYNFYREQWLIDRFAGTLEEVFGHSPCIDARGSYARFAVLVTALDPGRQQCERVWERTAPEVAPPASDDHPFPYLRTRSLPTFYLITIGLILLVSLITVRRIAGRLASMRSYLDLFFMGAAFLLLETKSVVQFALLFGTTWFVNALVFAGILLSVLAAIEISRHIRFRRPARLYVALLLTLVVAWLVPLQSLLALKPLVRFGAATLIAFAPILLANLVFAQRFRDVGSSTTAFGANLLGAMVGGLLEYASLITGYRALLLVVALLYGLAFLFGRRLLREPPDRMARSTGRATRVKALLSK